jgi:hypothetical protein
MAQLSGLDPKLFEQGFHPELIQKLSAMLSSGQLDPSHVKELRMALDAMS